jgi:SSS family solute:Na+ symporter
MTETAAQLSGGFTWIDWAVVVGLFAFTHWIGQWSAGKPSTIREFFLGGRKLPWYAVSASIIATEISAVTLISLPATVFNVGGNITYLQLGLIGLFLARWIVALWLIPKYYEREIYSPYDYMGNVLGPQARTLTTILFSIGGVLGQAARVYLTGIVLQIVLNDELAAFERATGIPGLWAAIAVIGVIAVVWTWLGGMATVIWTDAVLFLIFLAAIVFAFYAAVSRVSGGVEEVVAVGAAAGKFQFFDLEATFARPYTIWAALIANTLVGVGAFGTDQLMAQRVFCCRNAGDAKKAMLASYGSMLVAVAVAMVGIALYAYYQQNPLQGAAAELYAQKNDRIFPIFIVEVMPAGMRGLIIAGAFAAAISSLDSILAALSQTVMSAFVLKEGVQRSEEDERRAVRTSKFLVLAFGVLLCVIAAFCEVIQRDERFKDVLNLALSMPTYTQGAVLATFALAFFLGRRLDASGLLFSAPLSVLMVVAIAWHEAWTRPVLFAGLGALALAWVATRLLAADETLGLRAFRTALLLAGCALVLWVNDQNWVVAWPWFAPAGLVIAFLFGWGLAVPRRA